MTTTSTAGAVGRDLDKLEQRLVLHNWVNELFGYSSTAAMLDDIKPADEGFDGEGRSYVYHRLKSQGHKLKLPLADLERYDDNVRHHLQQINRNRAEPVVLKYFQHLAALYTEVLLDHRFNAHEAVLRELNTYAESLNDEPIRFGEGDLNRIALWMATGSGKTLLMHLNYLQFLHYNTEPLDNILLITPNEKLTEQHLGQMRLSGIPCERFSGASSGLDFVGEEVVRATEITKLIEEKKGGGFSVDVEAFEGRNLVFVDEGHKGAASGAGQKEGTWLRRRRTIAQGGFTFEYSATFGQALAKGTRKEKNELIADYGRSILFDYSYRYFYGDGYGKDFQLLNLKDPAGKAYADLLLLGNLLSFYQQKLCYADLGEQVEEYNLEPPLWILVGSKVDAVYSENKEQRSDVYDVVSFLHRFLTNEGGWSIESIKRLMDGDSGLENDDGHDVFEGNLTYLKKSGKSHEAIFRNVVRRVFRSSAAGSLILSDIKGASGELGLRVSGSEDGYFGLIYIGDTAKFKKLVGERAPDILVEDDAIGGELFTSIDRSDSQVNVLIGARKFVEGWSSWRVSNMGLLNVGSSEGPMIIQLFGRGVRLKGKGFSLKRSSALDGELPEAVLPLETLNVFGLRANYMARFKDYLEREGVDPDGYETLPPLPLLKNEGFLREGLLIPRPPEEEFGAARHIVLDVQPKITVNLDLSVRLETGRMGTEELETQTLKAGRETRPIDARYLSMLGWHSIYLDLLEFKSIKGLSNLIIPPEVPREIIENPETFYRLVANQDTVEPKDFDGLSRLQEVVQVLLRKYVEKFYHQHQQRWDSERMTLEPLTGSHANFADYTVKVRRSSRGLIEDVTALIEGADEIYRQELKKLPNVYFDRHLYQPLLVEKGSEIKSTPVGLKESELNFVRSLRDYCTGHPQEHRKVFLLRNLSRGKGIGFFKTAGFYPDFILWVKNGDRQRIVFIEPHGMRNEDPPPGNDKVDLYLALRDLSDRIAREDGREILLDSYIISATPYVVLEKSWGEGWTRRRFAKKHILFEDDLEAGIATLFAPRDELEHQIITSYPYPLASGFRSLMAAGDPRDLYREQLRFAENLLAFLASVCLALLRGEDRGPDARLDLRRYWSGGISPGDWKDIIQRSSKVFRQYRDVPLATAIERPNIGSEKKGFGRDIFELIRAKNDYKHDRGPTEMKDMANASDQVQGKLRRCMEALAFLTEYPILQVDEVEADSAGNGFFVRCLRYMGANPDFPWEEGYLPIAPRKDELYLDLGDNNWMSLYPFVVPGTRMGSETAQTYFIDAWDAKKGSARLKSFQRGHTLTNSGVSGSLTALLQGFASQGAT